MTKKRFYIKHERTIKDNKKYITENGYVLSYKNDAEELCNLLNALVEENEQLKSTIKKVIELLNEEIDVFSEKATEHDLNAYRELQQLDNKDAYYMAIAIKEAIKLLKGDMND